MADERNRIEEYYREINPEKREEILTQLLEEESCAENRIRKELYDLRYTKKKRADGGPADNFMNLWMMTKIAANSCKGFFGSRSARKDLTKHLNRLGILEFMERGDVERELLYREFYHLTELYISTSRKDKTYGSAVMGLVPLKDEQVLTRLAEDVYAVAYLVPLSTGLEKEYAMLAKAATDAFCDILPEKKEYLEEMIAQNQGK